MTRPAARAGRPGTSSLTSALVQTDAPAADVGDGTVDRRGSPLGRLAAWITRPTRRRLSTSTPELAGKLTSLLLVAGTVAFVFVQLHPSLLLGPNMDVGGDTAGHVVAVHYFIHEVLARGHLSGWDPQWFDGFPLYVFYFPLPPLLVAGFSLVLPYAVAFKVVTALGPLLMPIGAYTFGRLAGYRRPLPALMAVSTLALLFLYASGTNPQVYVSWNIDGGSIASTMAGEFSYTLGVAAALFFLGVFTYSLRTGRLRWLAAVLFLVTLLCHVVPALFAAAGATVLALCCGTRRSFYSVLLPVGLIGGLLGAFWLLPFGAYLRYSSSMGYARVGHAYQNLVPQNGEMAVPLLALVGLGIAIARRDRVALALAALAAASALGFVLLPSGLVYNGRWLPFWFLTTSLLAAYGVSEAGRAALARARTRPWHATATGLAGGGIGIALFAGWLGVLPFYSTPAAEVNPAPAWASWNYSGYQSKPGWKEFKALVAMLQRAASRHGCGRLDYEYSPNMTDDYGSTLVPMSFPLWTDGCIDTTEGLYYESSTTTDFHFLDQSELSLDSSDPVVGLPYQPTNVADGIRHLQLEGVKYFLANSPAVEQAADADPSLVEVGTSPASAGVIDGLAAGQPAPPGAAWRLYLIRDAPLVTPLSYEPVVERGLSKLGFQSLAISWYQHEQYWPVPIARSGPSSWRREPRGTLVGPGGAVPVASTTVSAVRTTNQSVAFDVTRTGTPLLVKVPYFPSWQASGAEGPYEVTPNLMVVVPRDHHVTLRYGTTAIETTGQVLTLVGAAGVALLLRSAGGPLRATITADGPELPAADGPEPPGAARSSPSAGEPEGGTTGLPEPPAVPGAPTTAELLALDPAVDEPAGSRAAEGEPPW